MIHLRGQGWIPCPAAPRDMCHVFQKHLYQVARKRGISGSSVDVLEMPVAAIPISVAATHPPTTGAPTWQRRLGHALLVIHHHRHELNAYLALSVVLLILLAGAATWGYVTGLALRPVTAAVMRSISAADPRP